MKRPFVRLLLLSGALGVAPNLLSVESVAALSSQFRLDTRSVAVGNVSVSSSGSSSVVVTYDLSSSFGKADVAIAVSSDGGSNFETLGASVLDPVSNVGLAVPAGSGRRIVWRVAELFPESLLPDVRIRVRGTQGGVTREAFSGHFTVDTRLTQNLKIDDIVVPAEILTGAECQGTVVVQAVTVPAVPVLLQITAGSVPVAVKTVPVNAWAAYAGAYAANIPFVWRPQEDQCREISLAAMIDPLNDNRVAESEERTDNGFQRNVRVRVRQVLGSVNGYTVYADICNRQAFQTAMKENGAGLYGALVAGSVEVERNGLPVVDSAKVVATLDALAAQLTEGARYSGRYHLSRRDKNLPAVYDNSMSWGIVDPLGNVVDSLLPDAAAAASARKDVLVSSVLQTSSAYDSVELLCDLVPALIGGIGCFKGVRKLSENNTAIFKDVTRLDYRMYLTYVNEVLSFDVLDDENSTISEPLLIEVGRLVTEEIEASKITIDRDMVTKFIKELLKKTKKNH